VQDLSRITNDLLRAGATIAETNCVRKHLDEIKGGRLARLSEPARTFVLALSDVVGDSPDVIASGPFSPDPTSFQDAIEVLTRFDLWPRVPAGVRSHLESGANGEIEDTPDASDPCFERISFEIIGNAMTAAQSACAHARALGYESSLIAAPITGEAQREGRILGELALAMRSQTARCSVAFGETTVTVRGDGSGGRNQEIALGAAIAINGATAVLVASMGTDGIDGPTDAAGAVATGTTLARGVSFGRDAETALGRNDAYPFFQLLNDLIRSGATGTNVMDLHVLMTGSVDHVQTDPYARSDSSRDRMG
jgi:glycerate-2-kinase